MIIQFIEKPTIKVKDRRCSLTFSEKKFHLKSCTPKLSKAISALQHPLSEEKIPDFFDSTIELAQFYTYMVHLNAGAFLKYTAKEKDQVIAVLEPQSEGFTFYTQLPKKEFCLSRLSLIRREGESLVLESGISGSRLILTENALSLVFALTKPQTFKSLQKAVSLSDQPLKETLLLLYNGKMLTEETKSRALEHWELHDLFFHQMTRKGSQKDSGGTYRFRDKYPPLPAIKQVKGERIPLYRPLIEENIKDPLFTQVLEERRSIREGFSEKGLNIKQLGEFLYRTSRIKEEHTSGKYEWTRRPYPGAGACYELEIYPVIQKVKSLEKGIYYYAPKEHALIPINTDQEKIQNLLCPQGPHVYFAITARFQRITWKYEKMGYAAILKDVGVLYQTMYLVGAAMKLAPCAHGGKNSRLLDPFLETDFFEESQVGEFYLSTLIQGEENEISKRICPTDGKSMGRSRF